MTSAEIKRRAELWCRAEFERRVKEKKRQAQNAAFVAITLSILVIAAFACVIGGYW